MKIGILTYHRSINYGAVMQCYATASELTKRYPDDEIEVIDYTPQFRIDNYKPTFKNIVLEGIIKNMPLLAKIKTLIANILHFSQLATNYISYKKKYQAFEDSMKFLPLSKESYRQNDHNEFRKSVYGKYDIIVVGSDCVWSWQTVPFPNAYYLCGDYNAVKMSIAASAGTDLLENISPENRILLADAVREFSYVGVRDSATEYILDNVCPDVLHYHNCDPTTILDPVIFEPYREQVRQRLIKAGISMDKPIVGIMGNLHIAKMAREIFGDSVQYVAIYVPNSHCDANLLDLNVMEWGAVFSFFAITFTTFFHGTMLSLVNRTPVMSFDFLPETDKQITKLHELYSRLDLPDFYWRYKKEFTDTEKNHIAKTAHYLLENPPKERITEELKKEALHLESFFNHITNLKNRQE